MEVSPPPILGWRLKPQLSQQLADRPMEINNRVLRLGKIVPEAAKVLPLVHKLNKPWISQHTLQLAKDKREMKQQRQCLAQKDVCVIK